MAKKINECPDGGYGWIVAIASATILGFASAIFKCTGTLYANMIQTTNFTRTQLAFVMVLPGVLCYILAIFPNKLATMYSFKVTLFSGVLLLSCGLGLSSLAINNMGYFTLTSVIIGIGFSFSALPCNVLTGLYFTKKRPIAMGLSLSLSGIPSLVLPVVLQLLINEYHLRSSLLLWSGISLHGCVAAMLIRQPTWALKTSAKQQLRIDKIGENQTFLNDSKNKESKWKINQIFNCIKLIFKELIQDCRHFRNCNFILLLGNRISFFFQFVCFSLIIPSFAMEQIEGITNIQAAFLLSVISISDIIARLFSGFINNFVSNRTVTYLIALTCLSILILLFQFTHTYLAILALCIVWGLFVGYIFVTYFVVMFDGFGPTDTPGAIALQFEVKGFCLLVSGPLMALVRELTGSYRHCFTVLAILTLLSVLPWLSKIKCNPKKLNEVEL